jgi:hypothetical protein
MVKIAHPFGGKPYQENSQGQKPTAFCAEKMQFMMGM